MELRGVGVERDDLLLHLSTTDEDLPVSHLVQFLTKQTMCHLKNTLPPKLKIGQIQLPWNEVLWVNLMQIIQGKSL